MTANEKRRRAELIAGMLDDIIGVPAIPLAHNDPFSLLVAVVLSARCTDARVNLVTPELFKLAGTPEEMAAQDPEAVQKIIRPCGLSPQKSRAIVGLSKIIVEKHGGNVPADFAALEALPGVGHKTASVVMSQAFGVPAFPVDTHIHRLAKRWGLSDGSSVEHSERDLKKVFPRENWNKLHLQIIHYARKCCPALRHDIQKCPICKVLAETFPEKTKK